ncbi:GIY-YIG nuclease family protein [Maribacter sp. ACAM166]|uniref:GIY-YIG nuclease family protein n=1 Tax=Maribacter sp. ACAM166 TaxID=2508996 RepID=UPI0010FD6D52|nr:GIY-YIG nuclease family protein [Maribacter sp. ACAM166]TLP78808.1 GIY-YIG nuclease family protein [Maribacter sp. ACAM166]
MNDYFQNQVNTQGVYFLIGTDNQTGKAMVYIGEAENVWERLKNHALNKDFCSEVILFTSKDDNITKSHVKYLESRLIEITKEIERCLLDNSNTPNLSSLPLPDRDSMEEFILNIKLLNGVFGHKFLEYQVGKKKVILTAEINTVEQTETYKVSEEAEFNLNVKNILAKVIQTDEEIIVLSGSEVSEKKSKIYGS